ncbi:MAG: hypothetical protein KBC50_02700 [Candidatus Pacebacteria bacterium]|nr:hypothetical protein [Candidatus Paceibacterota bacterium]
MITFFYELFGAFRGIDWFLIILLGMLLTLSFIVGITENSLYREIEMETLMQGFNVHVLTSLYMSPFMYAFIVYENEKIFSILGNVHVFIPYIIGILFPFLVIALHVILLLGGVIIRALPGNLYDWYQWKKMATQYH